MSDAPAIPYGYRRIQGPSQRGDGIWDGTRFRKVRKAYPNADGSAPVVIIRKCVIEQPELPGVEPLNLDE